MAAKSTTTRRSMLKGTGAAVLAAPLYVSRALASSGEINIVMWADYLPQQFLSDFEAQTGIKVNYTGIGSNEEIIELMQASGGKGYDIVSPTNFRAPQWEPLDLLQPFDLNRVNVDAINLSMLRLGTESWNFNKSGTHWLPHIWGTEGIGYRTDLWQPGEDGPSYGDIWSEETAGRTMGRVQSMLLTAGLYLERIGEVEPEAMWDAYEDEDLMRRVWGQVTDWCIERQQRVKLLWNDAETQKDGFLEQGIVVGQTWDGPPLALKTDGQPVNYQAPVEGAMAWVDGMSMSAAAANIDQVYAFIDFAFQAKPAGEAIDDHGYNSPVLGAEDYANEIYKRNFAEAYPGDSLAKLNPWLPEQLWYASARSEFVQRFVDARGQ